jgi:photosystem II stability/assembly factor-like uncharacterized protein
MDFIVPITPDRIFAASPHGGVWRTADGGQTWSCRTDRLGSMHITALAADDTGTRVFAATWFFTRLLRSLDGGLTFTEHTIGPLTSNRDGVDDLIVDSSNPGTLYAVTNPGLLRSQDDGLSWEIVLPPDGNDESVFEAVVLSGVQHRVLATRGGLLYSSSTGDPGSFTEIVLPLPGDGHPPFADPAKLALAPVPGQPHHVYMAYIGADEAVYESIDYGASPVFTGRHPRAFHERRLVASADGTTLYNGEHCRIPENTQLNRYADHGVNHGIVSGPYHADLNGLASTTDPYIYLATDGGVFRYHEPDPLLHAWFENLNGNLRTLWLYRVAASRGSETALVAGTQDNGAIVYRGQQWKYVGAGDAGHGFLLTDDPNTGGVFEIISGTRMLYIDGDVATIPDPPGVVCPLPTKGTFVLDSSNPDRVCRAVYGFGDNVLCSEYEGRWPWCTESSGVAVRHLSIVDANHAWALGPLNTVWRTTSGLTGTWNLTADLPMGVRNLDAPEGGDPDRALVFAGVPPQVYETTDGGLSWVPRGVPPLPDPGEPCPPGVPSCDDQVEGDGLPTAFGVTFGGPLLTEVWYVGTNAGLLASVDGGNTWLDTDVPHSEITDLDTYGNVVTVATRGRGAWQRVEEVPLDEIEVPVEFDPFWWLHHNPVFLPELWASELIDQSGDLIQEVRLPGGSGRVFRRGDAAFGAHDFRITSGVPLLAKSDSATSVTLIGPRSPAQPIALQAGWNAVGIVDPSLTLASQLIADAAAQGLLLGAVVDGGGQNGILADRAAGRAPEADFALEEARGVWVFACGDGGLWTPGASGMQGAALSTGAGETTARSDGGSARGQPTTCPDLDSTLANVAADLTGRMPEEFLVCIPEQTVDVGGTAVPICDGPPPVDTDLRVDYSICSSQSDSHGCAVTLWPKEIREDSSGELTVVFDAEANGTATLSDGTVCPVNASVSDASFLVTFREQVDPPAIDLVTVGGAAPGLVLDQEGCGPEADALIAGVVAAAVEQALDQQVSLRLSGLAPHCSPDFPLPDSDLDGTVDCNDGCPLDPDKTDPGACGCGVVDDVDGDGFAFCGFDCNDTDETIWATPGEVRSLTLFHDRDAEMTILDWSPPLAPGGDVVRYDVLVALAPDAFDTGECVESDDDSDTQALSFDSPRPDEILHFLVRGENRCPDGQGTLGTDSAGIERSGRNCP